MTEPKTVLADAVYERLKKRASSINPPRERLNIDALAVDLSVSPTPIREALARLSAERLVTFATFSKGTTVYPPVDDGQELKSDRVRRLIEVDAARLATAQNSDSRP